MKPTKKAIIGLFVAVPIIWCIAWFFLSFIASTEARGQFGDMFGAVNALFSGWAFVGVIVAILLQKEELELQRKELAETTKEFKRQNKTMQKQRFENTFFNLLSLHNEIVSSIAVPKGGGEYHNSREAFSFILENFKRNYAKNVADVSLKKTQSVFTDVYARYEHVLGHYYRNLYRIYVFIENSDIEDKDFYAKIIRAQLSNSEWILLFYNSYFLEEGQKFRDYAARYDVFEKLPEHKLAHKSDVNVLDARDAS